MKPVVEQTHAPDPPTLSMEDVMGNQRASEGG